MHILTIGGSPSHPSRSAALLDTCRAKLQLQGHTTDNITVRDLSAEELIQGRFDGPSLKAAFAQVAAADGIIIATPVYKAAYTGVLKAFFDLMPANVLGGKVILPIALGGSLAHSLVIDYALGLVSQRWEPAIFCMGFISLISRWPTLRMAPALNLRRRRPKSRSKWLWRNFAAVEDGGRPFAAIIFPSRVSMNSSIMLFDEALFASCPLQ